jgi:sigma-E factor negative regulatory protein RseB
VSSGCTPAPRGAPSARLARIAAVVVAIAVAPVDPVRAQDAAAWLGKAAKAARELTYVGTIVYQHGPRVETSRLTHLYEGGAEYEKLVNLDGPAREVIRSQGEVRCYYPDAKIVRVEPRTFRNVFPSLSPQQQQALAQFYEFRVAEAARVAGLEAQAIVFEPRDGLRYGHKFWVHRDTGLLLKARLINEKGEAVEQFAFTDISIGARVERDHVKPSWPGTPPDWQLKEGSAGDAVAQDTGWAVTRLPPGFVKVNEGFRTLRGKRDPVAHLVFSDGLVAVSVFVESIAGMPGQALGTMRQGGLNVYSMKVDDHFVTVLGEAPAATVRQIALSVARR